jgi:hypothetical protein
MPADTAPVAAFSVGGLVVIGFVDYRRQKDDRKSVGIVQPLTHASHRPQTRLWQWAMPLVM